MRLPVTSNLSDAEKAELATYVGELRDESRDAFRPHIAYAELGQVVYAYGSEDETEPNEMGVNPIQNAVLTARDTMAKDGFQITLEPVETGEPPTYYWNGPQRVAESLGLDAFYYTTWTDETGEQHPPVPLDPDFAEEWLARSLPKGVAGPDDFREDWIVPLDDRLVADELQGFFDVHWERVDTTFWCEDNMLDTGVQGWAYGLYQFDDNGHRHEHKHLPLDHVYMDPTARDIADAAYAGFFEPMDADEAKRNFSDLADIIEANAIDGTPVPIDGNQRLSGVFNVNFRRKFIPFSVMWIRNQPIALTKEEAIESGEVVEQQVLDAVAGGNNFDLAGAGGDLSGDAEGLGASGEDEGTADEVDDAGKDTLPGFRDNNDSADSTIDQPTAQATLSPTPPSARIVCVLKSTGEEITPTIPDPEDPSREIIHPKWPKRLCVRQITQIGPAIVDYRESEFGADGIPILHNVNIQLSGRRGWGIGEPNRLQKPQKGLNKSLTNMLDHQDMYSHPPSVESQSMNDALPEEYREGFAHPGQRYIIPDDLMLASKGKVQVFQDPPPLSQADTFLAQYLSSLIDRESGNTDVLQGRANSQVKSGVAIGALQSAAASLITSKARRTERMIKKLGRLHLHSLLWRETIHDFGHVCRKYPDHILAAIWDRRRYIEWDLKVAVEGGSGGAQMQKRQLAQMDREARAISMQTYRERTGNDDRVEKRRIRAEDQTAARDMALMAPVQAQPGTPAPA